MGSISAMWANVRSALGWSSTRMLSEHRDVAGSLLWGTGEWARTSDMELLWQQPHLAAAWFRLLLGPKPQVCRLGEQGRDAVPVKHSRVLHKHPGKDNTCKHSARRRSPTTATRHQPPSTPRKAGVCPQLRLLIKALFGRVF